MKISAAIFQNTAEAILITDKHNQIIAVNKAFSKITGYSESEAIHQDPRLLKSNTHDDVFFTEMWSKLLKTGTWQGETWNRRKNGEVFPAWSTITAVKNEAGNLLNYLEVFSDISQLKSSQERVDFLSFHEPLTHLPNRLLFNDRLEGAIQRAQREDHQVALLFLDLDRFKIINDSLGHPVGDLLLKKAAERISKVIRAVDTASRLGGDEFVVVINNIADNNGAEVLAKKILAVFTPPFHLSERDFHLTVSIGISLYPKDGAESATLIKNADTAMYLAKEEDRNTYRFYTPVLSTAVLKRLTLETSLRQAIKKTESFFVKNTKWVIKVLQALLHFGLTIAIDDFGTGYSSLSYLKELPINTLKIDRSFIKDLPENNNGKAIVSTMLTLARGLQHKVIAEGIETAAQQTYFKSLGCSEGQGYLYSEAQPLYAFAPSALKTT